MMRPSYLVVAFIATAGKQGEDLGSDEEQIVLFVYLLYDIANNKVVAVQTHYVRPSTDDMSDPVLTEECKQETGLTDEQIRNGQPLETVMDEFDRFISSKEIHPDHGGRPFCFCIDGPLPFRMSLHPESCNKGLPLPKYFFKYFDLRKEFTKMYKVENINSIGDMLTFLSIEGDLSLEYGVRQCHDMARILQKMIQDVLGIEEDNLEYGVKQCHEMGKLVTRMLNDGHMMVEPEIIKERLEPGICQKDEVVDDDCVVRARGLPWQSSDQDIARFLRGLNVAKGGVALCLSKQGRRNGEALIRFECKEHRDMALRKHKHHLKQRYIEVYKATGRDFVNVAGGNNTEAQTFLSRHSSMDQTIVRMRGLPYTATAEQVLQFFHSGEIIVDVLDNEDGILFVRHPDGRSTGDAFVLFGSEEEANKALTKHKQCIGTRYIELFKSTTAEVQQVLNQTQESSNDQANDLANQPLIPHLPTPLNPYQTTPSMPQQAIICGATKDCIRLRGLPFEATVTDILTFLGEHSRNIVFHGVHLVYNSQGTFSGEAFIQMNSELAAESAAINRHKKYMIVGNKKRYIEVLQCSGDDMNMILSNGLPPPPQQHPMNPMMSQAAAAAAAMNPGLLTRQLLSPAAPNIPVQTSTYPNQMAQVQNGMYGMANMTSPQFQHPMSVASPITAIPQQALPQATQGGIPGIRPGMNPYGFSPMLYWYPSPPVSPQSTYYVHANPTTVILKGLPLSITAQELLTFFDGVFEIPPDIQIQHGADGRPSGEAIVTFASRIEAERAVAERSRKPFGNRFLEMLVLAQ